MTNQIIEEKAVEYAERATIVYANYTGRDEEHRSEFRAEMLKLFRTVLHQADQAGYARAMGEARTVLNELHKGKYGHITREVRDTDQFYKDAWHMLDAREAASLSPTDNNKKP